MGVFANNAITDAGRILEGELKMGAVFTPTRIVMGSGFLPSGTTARTIKDVISPVISLQINKKNMSSNGTVIIGGVYSNAEIQSDFYFRELALYAKAVKSDGSATDEILYSYGNAGNAADLMPAYTSETAVEKQIDLVTYVGIDVKVDLTIESGIYVTQKQLEDALNGDEDIQQILNEHIGNKQNPHGVTAAQIGAYNKAETNNLINTHINNKQNPHGVTAAQVGAYDKNQSLTSTTAGLFGLSASAVPNDVLAKILIDSANNNANTKCKIQRGTYVGTGTYGSSTPNILNFNFQPYVVVITGKREIAICNCTEPKSMAVFSLLNNGSGCYGCDTKVSGNQLTWWFYSNNVAGNEIFQMNSSGETYTYTVIGY